MKFGPRLHDSDSSANRSPRSGCSGSMTVISRITRSKMGADPDDRRRQDDHRHARPPYPSLRHHRDRQHQLALQEPKLTSPPDLIHVGAQEPPTPSTPRNARALRSGRGSLLCPHVDKPGLPFQGVGIGRETGVALGSDLTVFVGVPSPTGRPWPARCAGPGSTSWCSGRSIGRRSPRGTATRGSAISIGSSSGASRP